MLSSSHPLAALQAEAALTTPWPVLHLLAEAEAEALTALSAVEATLGPQPQAELLEPWPGEPWELRLVLPGLAPDGWARVSAAVPGASLVPGRSPGRQAAVDQGQLQLESLDGADLSAVLPFDADHGGVLLPELARVDPGADTAELEAELLAALVAALPGAPLVSDRGEDRVQAVVDRGSGRVGVQLGVADAWLMGQADLPSVRQAAVDAVARVVTGREGHPSLRLAPDLLWDSRPGLLLTVWLIGPRAEPLPAPVARSVSPAPWVDRLAGLAEGWELQLAVEPADHDAVVGACLQVAREHELFGGAPRWLRWARGWRFTPTWTLPPTVDPRPAAAALEAVAGVLAVRVVPGELVGLGEIWTQSDVWWWPSGPVCFVRVRDGLESRDRLERTTGRAPDLRDAAVLARLRGAAEACTDGASVLLQDGRVARPIVDTSGRPGLAVQLDARESMEPVRLGAALESLGRGAGRAVAAVGTLALRDGAQVHLWYPDEPAAEPRIWV